MSRMQCLFRNFVCIVRTTEKSGGQIMSEVLEFHISCPQCNYSNTATSSISKYKEIVYQPCNDDVGLQDHNVKDQMSCDNCYDSFEFYWCAGHKMVENNAGSGR